MPTSHPEGREAAVCAHGKMAPPCGCFVFVQPAPTAPPPAAPPESAASALTRCHGCPGPTYCDDCPIHAPIAAAPSEARDRCAACQLTDEAREARCAACTCVERAEIRADAERTHHLLASVTATLQLGVEGVIPVRRALEDAFVEAFGHLYGPDDALRIVAEGVRHDL